MHFSEVNGQIRYLFIILIVSTLLFSCGRKDKEGINTETNSSVSFALSDVNGNRVNLNDFKGRVVIVEFFASWCAPCQLLAPEIQAVYERFRNKGLIVLAVSLDEGPDARVYVDAFIKNNGISYPVVIDDGSVSRRFGVFSIPTSIIIDRDGIIRNRHVGLIPDFSQSVSKEIEKLL